MGENIYQPETCGRKSLPVLLMCYLPQCKVIQSSISDQHLPALMLHLIPSSQPRKYFSSNTQTPNPLYFGHWAKASQALSLIQTDTQTLLQQDFSQAESLCLLQKHVCVRFPRQRVVLVHLWRKANTRDRHGTKHKDKAHTLKDRTGQKQVGLRTEQK